MKKRVKRILVPLILVPILAVVQNNKPQKIVVDHIAEFKNINHPSICYCFITPGSLAKAVRRLKKGGRTFEMPKPADVYMKKDASTVTLTIAGDSKPTINKS